MAKEIETKFLCSRNTIEQPLTDGLILKQAYIHVSITKQLRVRLSLTEKKAWICLKYMLGKEGRDEYEYEIPYNDAEEIYDKCIYKFKKDRFKDKTVEGYPIDIDCYSDGVIVAEVELPAVNTPFTKPNYFTENIDGVHRYCNYYYAGIPKEMYN